jgi:hypothetical protein
MRGRATFVSSLERGVIRSPVRSIEKSSNRFVVAQCQVVELSAKQIIRNENQTIPKQFQAGSVEDISAFLKTPRPDARTQHGSV